MTPVTYVDTHCHLLMPKLAPTLPAILERCQAEDVTTLINIALGPGPDQLLAALELQRTRQGIYTAAGIHPHNASDANDAFYALIRKHRDALVMVGEIGLDYHYNFSDPESQRRVFRDQIALAHEVSLPVILHIREAHEEALSILREQPAPEGSIVHCYTGDAATAARYLDLGFYISFSGIVTFPKSLDIQEAARVVPRDRILAETDAPYLAPVPFRGRLCEPWHVKHTVAKLALLREISLEEMAQTLLQNARRAFALAPR